MVRAFDTFLSFVVEGPTTFRYGCTRNMWRTQWKRLGSKHSHALRKNKSSHPVHSRERGYPDSVGP